MSVSIRYILIYKRYCVQLSCHHFIGEMLHCDLTPILKPSSGLLDENFPTTIRVRICKSLYYFHSYTYNYVPSLCNDYRTHCSSTLFISQQFYHLSDLTFSIWVGSLNILLQYIKSWLASLFHFTVLHLGATLLQVI